MTALSPELADAYERLHAAITDVLRLDDDDTEPLQPGEIVTRYAAVAVIESADANEAGATKYASVFPNGTMPAHEIVGLFVLGQRQFTED